MGGLGCDDRPSGQPEDWEVIANLRAEMAALRTAREDAAERITVLEGELARARAALSPPGEPIFETVLELERRLDDARAVIVFAVANLDVLTYPKWPFQELRRLGQHLLATPGDSPEAENTRTLGGIWIEFAAEAESWEQSRAEGTHKARLQAENLMRAPTALLQQVVTETSQTSQPEQPGRPASPIRFPSKRAPKSAIRPKKKKK